MKLGYFFRVDSCLITSWYNNGEKVDWDAGGTQIKCRPAPKPYRVWAEDVVMAAAGEPIPSSVSALLGFLAVLRTEYYTCTMSTSPTQSPS